MSPSAPAALDFTTLDVFTTTKYAGNPLAVVHLPTNVTLTQHQKQTIAREFNLSETVFLHVPPPTTASASAFASASASSTAIPEWTLDIFTPTEELPFAGHPTIGTACHVLQHLAGSSSQAADGSPAVVKGRFLIKAGTLELSYAHGEARAGIPHNVHVHAAHTLSAQEVLARQPGLAAHLQSKASGEALELDVVSPVRGMNFANVELDSLEALAAVATMGARVQARLDAEWDVGPLFLMFYVRLPSEDRDVVRLRTRMIEGSFEDPATGSASIGLAALIALREKREGRTRFEMVQAVEMGRRSDIGIEVVIQGGKVQTVELVGKAVKVMEGKVFYE